MWAAFILRDKILKLDTQWDKTNSTLSELSVGLTIWYYNKTLFVGV